MYKKKLQELIEASRNIRNAMAARDISLKDGDLRPLKNGVPYEVSPEGEVSWKEDPKDYEGKEPAILFSTAHDYLDKGVAVGDLLQLMDIEALLDHQQQEPLDRDFEAKLKSIGIDPSTLPPRKRKFRLLGDRRMLRDGFQFSDDSRVFGAQLDNVIVLFASTKGKDEEVDYLAMRALRHAGKIEGGLRSDGYYLSEKKGDVGSKPKKNRYTDDELKEAFDQCHAKNPHAMWLEIDTYLNDHKKRTGDTRAIPSERTILRWLKKTGLENQLPK